MKTAIAKWGNSLGLRIPRGVAEDANLREGLEVDIAVENGKVVISTPRKRYDIDTLMAQFKPEHRHTDTDADGPVGKEVW